VYYYYGILPDVATNYHNRTLSSFSSSSLDNTSTTSFPPRGDLHINWRIDHGVLSLQLI